MAKKVDKVDFDMSVLTLSDLVKVYEDINNFMIFLDDKKIEDEKAEEDNA